MLDTLQGAIRRITTGLGGLWRDRTGATAVIVALTLPTLIVGVAAAVATSSIELTQTQLDGTADAAAAAGRSIYNSYTSGHQQAATDEAVRISKANGESAAVAAGDVVEGWWDVTLGGDGDKFGPCVPGQTGLPFCNAIRVTAHLVQPIPLGSLLGKPDINLAAQATGYKCSNLDYPLTKIADDVPSPALPAFYSSWATPGHDANTSYYYQQPDGSKNPVFKFYSPVDGQDVSFVVTFSNGYMLQVDTYCRGTFLVSPAAFDIRNFVDSHGKPVTITSTVLRGSTNNSFAVYPDQNNYPFQSEPTPYVTADAIPTPQYDLSKVHTTGYPSAYGYQNWASEGDPTPDRRAVLVRSSPCTMSAKGSCT